MPLPMTAAGRSVWSWQSWGFGLALSIAALYMDGNTSALRSGDEILAAMAAHQLADNRVLVQYTCLRRYTLRNSRFNMEASMTVRVDFHRDTGKRFTVLSQTGSARLYQRVFEPLLQTETEESRPSLRATYALDPANYRAELLGGEMLGGRDCWVLAIQPRRRSRFLIRGKLWVDVHEVEPVQLQGNPAGSVSFWVAEPLITEVLHEWNGFWLPAENTSISRGFLLGTSEMTIDYLSYDIPFHAPPYPHRKRLPGDS